MRYLLCSLCLSGCLATWSGVDPHGHTFEVTIIDAELSEDLSTVAFAATFEPPEDDEAVVGEPVSICNSEIQDSAHPEWNTSCTIEWEYGMLLGLLVVENLDNDAAWMGPDENALGTWLCDVDCLMDVEEFEVAETDPNGSVNWLRWGLQRQ